jgi:hypothetical protein
VIRWPNPTLILDIIVVHGALSAFQDAVDIFDFSALIGG